MIPYYLVLAGLILIFLEFYLPGMVLGILGALAILSSFFLLISQGAQLAEITFFIGGALLALYFVIRFALWSIPRARAGRSIYLAKDQEGYVASSYDATLIGKVGAVLTDLKPGGYILIEGKQHPALSVSGYLIKGTPVVVLSGEGENLIVKENRL